MENGDLPPNARRILDAAQRADDPSGADRARIDAAFANRLHALGIAVSAPAANVGSGASTAQTTASGAGLSSKAALAVIGAGIVVAAFIRLPHASEPKAEHRVATATAPTRVVPGQPVQPKAPAPATAETSPAAPEAPAARVVQPPARNAAPARRTQLITSAAQDAPADALSAELALLEAANGALRDGRFAAALRAIKTHERRFANGALREERLGLRVLALCGLGDYAAGNAARDSFLRDAPHSVLARKVVHACADRENAQPRGRDGQSE